MGDWFELMKWNGMDVFPRCLIKANVWAIGLCDCTGKLIAPLCPLWLWSSCNFPAFPFSFPAALKWWTQTTSFLLIKSFGYVPPSVTLCMCAECGPLIKWKQCVCAQQNMIIQYTCLLHNSTFISLTWWKGWSPLL